MSQTLQIPIAEVFQPLLDPARYKGAYGGRGSGKSHAFADSLIEKCLVNPGTRFVCIREVQKSLDDSVKQLLEDKITGYGLHAKDPKRVQGHEFRILNTHIECPSDGQILFVGMQNHTAESIKSLEGQDGAWVEEAQTLSQYSLDLLVPTIRKEGSELWFSWNPRHKTDPVDVLFRGPNRPTNSIVVKANYTDNPWLPKVLLQEIEDIRRQQPEKYAHIWLGDYHTISELSVFKNWAIESVPTPAPQTVFYFGADWGFSVDPTVLVRCWLEGRTLYVDREVYKIGCPIEDTPALFDRLEQGQARKWTIIADSARPEIIDYMRRHGYHRMQPSRKGAGSVEEGITFLQNYRIVVDPSCRYTSDELSTYSYKQDKLTGNVLPILEDKKNHVIDALRYAVETLRAVKPVLASVGPKSTSWQDAHYRR